MRDCNKKNKLVKNRHKYRARSGDGQKRGWWKAGRKAQRVKKCLAKNKAVK